MLMKNKVVLAYSGGLDTSVVVKLLQTKYDYDVITVTVDVGQDDDFKDIEEKSKVPVLLVVKLYLVILL